MNELILIISIVIYSPFVFATLTNIIFFKSLRSEEFNINEDLFIDSVSVLIPARNEEKNIGKCLNSPGLNDKCIYEILVYDDDSTDNTKKIVEKIMEKNGKLKLIKGSTKPQGWVGKTNACFELSKKASSPYFLFLDADTELNKNVIKILIHKSKSNNITLISAWPKLLLKSFPEKILMPMLNFLVFSTYPGILSSKVKSSSMGIAHGAMILCNADIYKKIGGHKIVKESLFEDTTLAKLWRANNEKTLLINGKNIVSTRMYNNTNEIWNGFSKNFYPAFNNDLKFFLFITFFLFSFVLFPILIILLSSFKIISIFLIFIVVAPLILRLIIDIKFSSTLFSAIFYPIPIIFMFLLGLNSRNKFLKSGVEWKGRKYKK
tara:strand:- start:11372 stop:12502 length:1131 start_codon:yes stop_codon:yes gene_type:complete